MVTVSRACRRLVYVSGAPGSGKTSLAEYDRPVGIGALVTVDTTVPVDVPAVAAAVRTCYDD
jgi:predicted ATPase